MPNKQGTQDIIDIINRKKTEWDRSHMRISEILGKCSENDSCPASVKHAIENEIRVMWSDLETYKTELEMQNDELISALQAAEEARADYVELFNSAPVGYIILNNSAIILNANQTFADMLNINLNETARKPFQNYIAREDISHFLSRYKSYFRNPSDKFFELRLVGNLSSPITVRIEGSRKKLTDSSDMGSALNIESRDKMEKGGSIELLLLSLSDVTALKKVEEEKDILKNKLLQSQKMEAIGTLAAGIAHDFNNILFPILGFAEMIRDDLKLKENIPAAIQREDILSMSQAIVANALRAKSLVQQILVFGKTDADSAAPILVNHVLTEIIVSTRKTLPSNISLVESIDNTCSMVSVDAEQIRQVVMNLIINALQAMENVQKGTLTITLKEDDFNETCIETGASVHGRYVCIAIGDTGHGIEKNDLSRIFDPYFSTRPKFKGSGLGLSIVHGILRASKGEITVKSTPGKGSEFSLFFPIRATSAEEKNTTGRKVIEGGNERILVIDDQPYITKLMSTMLKKLGYDVIAYNDPKRAVEYFRKDPFAVDLVLTDMTMPGMTGDKVAVEVMQMRPDTPIMILTGYSERLSPKEAEQMGISGYLMKPVALAELASSLRKALRKD